MGWLKRFLGLDAMGNSERTEAATPDRRISSRASEGALGFVDGHHFTEHVDRVKQLKREERHDEAISLLNRLVDATEQESASQGYGVAPWYYEQLAIIYRKQKRFADEIAILERYEGRQKAPGAKPGKLAERLQAARRLAESRP